jgi:hypothetical protein
VRDADDVPWIDVHKEEGAPIELLLPARLAARVSVEEREITEQGSRVLRRAAFEGLPAEPRRLAFAPGAPLLADARGPGDALRLLFAAPFGPRAMAAYQADAAREEAPVYGVSRDDAERMRLLLTQVAQIERAERYIIGAGALAAGTFSLGAGIGGRAHGDPTPAADYGNIAIGALSLGLGGLTLFLPSSGERLLDDFTRSLSSAGPTDTARLVAGTERRLFDLARRHRTRRWISLGFGIAIASFSAFGLVAEAATPNRQAVTPAVTATFVTGALGGGLLMANGLVPSAVERMTDLWSADPSLTRLPRLTLAPLAGGASLGLGGVF